MKIETKGLIFLGVYTCCWTILATVGFMIAAEASVEAVGKQFFSFNKLTQVANDWQTESFSSLAATNETYCPDTHPILAFSRYWLGNDQGCSCVGIYSTRRDRIGYMENKRRNEFRCNRNETRAGCQSFSAHHPVLMG